MPRTSTDDPYDGDVTVSAGCGAGARAGQIRPPIFRSQRVSIQNMSTRWSWPLEPGRSSPGDSAEWLSHAGAARPCHDGLPQAQDAPCATLGGLPRIASLTEWLGHAGAACPCHDGLPSDTSASRKGFMLKLAAQQPATQVDFYTAGVVRQQLVDQEKKSRWHGKCKQVIPSGEKKKKGVISRCGKKKSGSPLPRAGEPSESRAR